MRRRPEKKPWVRRIVRYLKPHRVRIGFAILAMVGVGFFGSFNFLLLKPALEVILGGRPPKRDITVTLMTAEGTTETLALTSIRKVEEAKPEARDITFVQESDDGTTKVLRLSGVLDYGQTEEPKSAKDQALSKIAPVRWARKQWDKAFAPIGDRIKEWDQNFKAYSMRNPTGALMLLAILLVAMSAVHAVCDFLAQYHMGYALYDLVRRLRDDLFRCVLSQNYLFFIRQSTGYLESRINSDVSAIRQTTDVLLTDAIQAPLRILFLFIVLLILNFQLTLIVVVMLPVAAVPLVLFARAIRKITRRSQRQADELSSTLEEALRNFKVIKCFQSEEHEAQRFVKRNLKLFHYILKRRIARYGAAPIMEILGATGGAAALLIGGSLILAGRLEFPTLMVYLAATTQFYSPLRKISRLNSTIQAGRVSAERIIEMLDLKSDLPEVPDPQPLPKIKQGIAFRDVTFIYDDEPVLRDLDFEVPVGKTVAIVGRSGAGKTTLAGLLMRLFDPQSGAIEIDGVDMREYKLSDLRKRIGMVTQETILFNDTVAHNIAYTVKEPDMDRVIEAARLANAHEFIEQLEGGLAYETVIGQEGQLLSGGQRQRIAIARAIYHAPDVMVFDEATSALDEKSQAVVQEAINNLLEGRTAFIIAHRLSTVRGADEILVLERGRLVERGSHDELIRSGGVYAALYQMIEAPETVPSGEGTGGSPGQGQS